MSKRVHHVTMLRCANLGITAMELTSNHSFPRHTHDEFGTGVILSGAQRSWSGRGSVESLPGDVITVNPGELHDGHPIDGAVRRWRIIYFNPRILLRELMPDAMDAVEFARPSLRAPAAGRGINRLFDRLRRVEDRLGVEEIVVHVVTGLACARAARDCPKHSAPVVRARARIEDDPSTPIALSELAALSGLSRYQIVRAFAREMGTTPYAYVIQCRVQLARRLLAKGATPSDAAQGAGFADQSHMTRAFVRQFGITPGRYRAGA